ncbi:MAG: hypothetical protein GWP70_02985, partial [Proteobacteria bacterium]|nr:hypothetical protein [Pseudomonadota bacterium]
MSDQPPKTETADDDQQLDPTAALTAFDAAEVNATAESRLTEAEATPEPQTEIEAETETETET